MCENRLTTKEESWFMRALASSALITKLPDNIFYTDIFFTLDSCVLHA